MTAKSEHQISIPPVDREYLSAVRQRYTEEANKRLRSERLTHFIQLTQTDEKRLQKLVEDPWVDHAALNAKPSPITNNSVYRHFVLGAGYGGLQYAIHLIEEGIATTDDIRLVDAAGGFGGTWYWNRFPGLHCDVESYVYLPLLEKTGYVPSKKYAPGHEIRAYAEHIAERWNLTDKTLFRTDVQSLVWDEQAKYWTIHVIENRGPSSAPAPVNITFHARYVYLAAGVLTKPQIPDIPGVLSFSGDLFHTARWDYTVTGGSQEDQTLSKLKGKKVAVVGTAATAIGVIPEVAKYAGELYVVQRTPAYVKPRGQRDTTPTEFQKVARKRGWQYERQVNLNKFLTNSAGDEENLVGDGWTDMPAYSAVLGSPKHGVVGPENITNHIDQFHALDLPHMEAIRRRVEQTVKDPDTVNKLKPWFPSWCKRPTFSDTYLDTFNRPNVHLLDTDGKGPSQITSTGIVTDKEYPVDIIIFGTGYNPPSTALGSPAARTNVQILGRGGLSLHEKWLSNGPATLHGYLTHGFPNLFFTGTNQATITGNNVFMLGLIAEHVAYIISRAERRVSGPTRQDAVIEVSKEAEEAHSAEILRRAAYYSPLAGCTPGYFNGYGEGSRVTDPVERAKRARAGAWSEGTVSFLEYIQRWREEGSLQGVAVAPVGNVVSKL